MNGDIIQALKQLEKERNIPLKVLQDAVESALTSSYRKNFEGGRSVRISIDWEGKGETRVIGTLTVVKKKEADNEITLTAAKKAFTKGDILIVYPPAPEIEESEEFEEDEERDDNLIPIENPTADDIILGARVDMVVDENPKKFGRIAAQTTKQVIFQKIREAERDIIFDEYASRVGDIMSVTIQRFEHKNWVCDLDRAEGVIPPQEQVPSENFRRGERIKAYVLNVEKTARGPVVTLSRTHPGLIRRLFEIEVPEIAQGLIEIHNVAREAGARSKVSVRAIESNVDPLGACVGPRGSRVQMVVDELKGEKIDIINYTDDPFTFVSNALSPAKVLTVTLNPEDRSALVIVPDSQFSLAIGKEGQNARLAAKLTNWKIDIKSESQAKEIEAKRSVEEEAKRKQEEEKRAKEAEELARREKEEDEKRTEEEKKQREEEALKKFEEQERKRRLEEEKKRREEEELQRLKDYVPKFDKEFDNVEAINISHKRDDKKEKKIEEALKHIPADMPIEQYVAMAFGGDEDIYPQELYGRTEPNDDRPKKKKKKKKQKKGGGDFDFDY